MSKFVIYLNVQPFLKQWLEYHYGSPVRFPDGSAQNRAIRRVTTRLQPGMMPRLQQPGDIAIVIPDSKEKDPAIYNHLTEKGESAMRNALNDLFMDSFIPTIRQDREAGIRLQDSIYMYCERHHISIDYANALRMREFRERECHTRHGVTLQYRERLKNKKKHLNF